MRQLLMKAGVPIVAGALVLAGLSGAASANTKHAATSKPTFDIAYEGPLSGGNAALGLDQVYSVEWAISYANKGTSPFGKLPFKLKFVEKDDQGSGTISPTDAQELVSNKAVIGVVGPAFSGATKAAEPTFSAAHLATVTPSATNAQLPDYGWNNFFRVVADDSVQGPSDADYIVKTLHVKKLYVVNDASTYGVGLAGSVVKEAQKDGATVTTNSFPGTSQCSDGTASPTQYPADAATVKSANPGLVFYAGYYCDLGLLLGALHQVGYAGKVFSDDGSDSQALVSGTNPRIAANGVYVSCACAALGTSHADKVFAAGFHELAHFAPQVYSAESYDATNVIIDELKILAAEKGGTKNITRSNVVTGLHKIKYVGITKTISFKAHGNINGDDIYVNQIRSGKLVQIGLE